MPEIRDPAVAGRFYPADPSVLAGNLRAMLHPGHLREEIAAQAVLVPHAGYVYSGAIAGETYAAVRAPRKVIVICPNHTGLGARRSVSSADAWRIPGGLAPVDAELRSLLVEHAGLELDRLAHLREHAVEVHLPFLLARWPDVSFVPVCLAGLSYPECVRVGEGIARSVQAVSPSSPSDVLVVASSDMSHYLPAGAARTLDALALEQVVALDPAGLYRVVRERGITMCGYIPATVSLVAALALGATSAELVRYGNSGDASGDMDSVVGYAGVVVS